MSEPPYPTLHPDGLPAGIVVGWPVTPHIAVAVDDAQAVILITPAGHGRALVVRSDVPDAGRFADTLRLARLYVAAVPVRRAQARSHGALPPDSDPAVRHAAFLALAAAGQITPETGAVDAEQVVSDFILGHAALRLGTGLPGCLGKAATNMDLFARTWTRQPETL